MPLPLHSIRLSRYDNNANTTAMFNVHFFDVHVCH